MSLLAPLFLLGFLGVALPWLLHRFSHNDPPQVAFPSTRFLKPSKPPVTRKRKLRHRFLLALRMLLLALICLLFTQPWWQNDTVETSNDSVHFFVIDTSLSMRVGNRWRQAIDDMRDLLGALPEQQAVRLFSASSELQELTQGEVSAGSALQSLATLQPSFEAVNYGELMQRIHILAKATTKPVDVTLVTDAQRSSIPAHQNQLRASSIRQLTLKIVSTEASLNFSVSAKARTEDGAVARVIVKASASGANSRHETRTIVVSHKERELGRELITLAPGETKTITLENLDLPVASASGTVLDVYLMQKDDLLEDNSIAVSVNGLDNVEFIMASLGENNVDNAQVYAQTALETESDAKVVQAGGVGALDINVAQHAMVFTAFDNVLQIPEAVSNYTAEGGNVLMVLRSLNEPSADVLAEGRHITQIDYTHPLALGDIDWFDSAFYQTPSLQLNDQANVLLALDDGTPLLAELSYENGAKLLLLNDPLSAQLSDLPLQPAFVSLMHQITLYFQASSAIVPNLTVGKFLSLPPKMQLLDPQGEALFDLPQLASANQIRLTTPGVYTVIGSAHSQTVAVELAPAESNLQNLSSEEITAWQAKNDNNKSQNQDDVPLEAANSGVVTENPQPEALKYQRLLNQLLKNQAAKPSEFSQAWLWRYLLPLLICVLLLESLMANRLLRVRRDS